MRSQLIDLVLSTDLAKHVEIVTRLRSLCASKGEGSWRREHAQEGLASSFNQLDLCFTMQVAIKFADLGERHP